MDIAYQAPFMNGFFNILSVVLGIAAIIFAIHSVQVRGCLICCTVSGGCVGLSLLFQLMELDRLAGIGDASAIYDTVHARVLAAGILLAVILVLNVVALLRGRKKDCDHC